MIFDISLLVFEKNIHIAWISIFPIVNANTHWKEISYVIILHSGNQSTWTILRQTIL